MLAVNVIINSALTTFPKEKFPSEFKSYVHTYPKASDFLFLGTYIPFSLGMKKYLSHLVSVRNTDTDISSYIISVVT